MTRGGHNVWNETGAIYGRWAVLRQSKRNDHQRAFWLCRCECGLEKEVAGISLRAGSSRGCSRCADTERSTTQAASPRGCER